MSAKYLVLIAFATVVVCGVTQAQTCNSAITATAPDYRFVDNGNGTVTDVWTGLMWKQCIEGMVTDGNSGCTDTTEPKTYDWLSALQRVVNVNAGTAGESLGWGDWRLPNVKELSSISELSCAAPAVNEKFFPLTFTPALANLFFWSSTQYAVSGGGLWFVNFSNGDITTTGPTALWGARLVRTLP